MGWEALLGSVIALSALIVFHEFGHFFVARRHGIGVLRFSLGFGPTLLSWRDRQGTDFTLSLLPLGGYVRMVDEREFPGGLPERYREIAFNRKSIGQRASVIVAGPLANLLLAFFLLFAVNNLTQRGAIPILAQPPDGTPAAAAGIRAGQEIVAVDGAPVRTWRDVGLLMMRRIGETGQLRLSLRESGQPFADDVSLPLERWLSDFDPAAADPIGESLGLALDRPPRPPLIERVLPHSPAERAGLRAGDRLVATDGASWSETGWVERIRANPGAEIHLDVERDGERFDVSLRLDSVPGDDGSQIGRIGVMLAAQPLEPSRLREYRLNPWQAAVEAALGTWRLIAISASAFGKLVTGELSFRHLSGPVGIVQAAGTMFASGLAPYLWFLALLSVSLGVVNLLPIPALDGGHLLFLVGERIMGRPLSARAQGVASTFGIAIVIGVMLAVTYNDLLRW